MTDELYQKALHVNEERARCDKIRALVVTTNQEVHESVLGQILHAAKVDLQSAENDLHFAELELRLEMLVEHNASGEKSFGCGNIIPPPTFSDLPQVQINEDLDDYLNGNK